MTVSINRKMSADSDFIYLSESFNIGIQSQNPDKNELICFSNSLEASEKFCQCLEQALEIDIKIEKKGDESEVLNVEKSLIKSAIIDSIKI
jgi:hypothetical protein